MDFGAAVAEQFQSPIPVSALTALALFVLTENQNA
jgi:hypothetical protein